MPGITPLTGTGQISVSEINKTKNLKQTTNWNQGNTRFSVLRDWFRTYAWDPENNMPPTGDAVNASYFHQHYVPGMRVRVANETSSHYRDQENAMISFSNFPGSTQHVNANESNGTQNGPGYYVDYSYRLFWLANAASNYPSGHRGSHSPSYGNGDLTVYTSASLGGNKGSLAASSGGTVGPGGVKATYVSPAGSLSGYDGFSGTGITQASLLPAIEYTVNAGGTGGNGSAGQLVTSGATPSRAVFTRWFKLPGATEYTQQTHTLEAEFPGDELNFSNLGIAISGDSVSTMAELITSFTQDLYDNNRLPLQMLNAQYRQEGFEAEKALPINGKMAGSTFVDSPQFQTSVLSAGEVIEFSGGAFGQTIQQLANAKGGITVNSGGGVRSSINGIVLQASGGLNQGDTLPTISGWKTFGRGNGGVNISNGLTYTVQMSGERPTGGGIADVIWCAMDIVPGMGSGAASALVYNRTSFTGYRSKSTHFSRPAATNLTWTASDRVGNFSDSCVFMLGTPHPDGDPRGLNETNSIHY